MTIKEALKKLFKSRGGDVSKLGDTSIAGMIGALAQTGGGNGSDGGRFTVNITGADTIDKTQSEVLEAINAGKAIYLTSYLFHHNKVEVPASVYVSTTDSDNGSATVDLMATITTSAEASSEDVDSGAGAGEEIKYYLEAVIFSDSVSTQTFYYRVAITIYESDY